MSDEAIPAEADNALVSVEALFKVSYLIIASSNIHNTHFESLIDNVVTKSALVSSEIY